MRTVRRGGLRAYRYNNPCLRRPPPHTTPRNTRHIGHTGYTGHIGHTGYTGHTGHTGARSSPSLIIHLFPFRGTPHSYRAARPRRPPHTPKSGRASSLLYNSDLRPPLFTVYNLPSLHPNFDIRSPLLTLITFYTAHLPILPQSRPYHLFYPTGFAF